MKIALPVLTLLTTLALQCDGLSQTTTRTSAISSLFAAPMAQYQRATLKRRLVRAAEAKDEPLVLSLVDELAPLNPTAVPTRGMSGYGGSLAAVAAPLNGRWRLLFTNARDAEAPARTQQNNNAAFGEEAAAGVDVTTGQRIDAAAGECVNFIRLTGERRPFDELEITIRMTPLSDTRVRLDFTRGRARNANAPLSFLRDVTFSFPPPAFGDLLARARGLNPAVEPQAYFDILYLDETVRAHRTGEGKIFVQTRDNSKIL